MSESQTTGASSGIRHHQQAPPSRMANSPYIEDAKASPRLYQYQSAQSKYISGTKMTTARRIIELQKLAGVLQVWFFFGEIIHKCKLLTCKNLVNTYDDIL